VAVADAAVSVAEALYEIVSDVLPEQAASAFLDKHTKEIEELVAAGDEWIPPCQVTSGDESEPFVPGDWRCVLFAAWICLIDAVFDNKKRGVEWPRQKIEFLYQAFDMNALTRTFDHVRRGLPIAK
jgi:hypothetical protein